ncbi:MAG TPA: hypothetical protein VH500_16660 [Nitrososphaeraceae archaeon]
MTTIIKRDFDRFEEHEKGNLLRTHQIRINLLSQQEIANKALILI